LAFSIARSGPSLVVAPYLIRFPREGNRLRP